MGQVVDTVPGLPTLDGPVPLMVEQLVDVLQLFDALIPVAEQVIDVPKIFIERIPPRTSIREPQLAEQLVEVPTIVSFSSLQRIVEQTVDIPVPQDGGRHADLQGFLRERVQQVSSRSFIFPVELFIAQDRVHLLQMGLLKEFFALFPVLKKARSWLRTRIGTAPESSPSTPVAQLEDSLEWVQLSDRDAGKTYYWKRRTRATCLEGTSWCRGCLVLLAQGYACQYV